MTEKQLPAVIQFTDDEVKTIKDAILPTATDAELKLFIAQCKRTGLDPFSRQIYGFKQGKGDFAKLVIGTSIDGARVIAERSGKYGGQLGPYWCGDDGVWFDIWLKKEPPAAAKVGIIRTDWKEPMWGIAVWDSYKQMYKDQYDGGKWKLSPQWEKNGPNMLAKCAEFIGHRKAFPNDLSGLYAKEELGYEEVEVGQGEVSVLQREGEQAISASADKAVPIEGSKTRGRPKQAAKVVEGVEPDSDQGREVVPSEVAQLREQARQVVAEIKEEHRSEAGTDDSAGDSPVDVEVTTGDTKLTAPEPLATVDDIMGVLHIGKLNGYSEGEIEAFAAKHFGITEEVDPLTVLTKTQVAQWKHAFSKKAVTA
jgi:phage recombination protein Bet